MARSCRSGRGLRAGQRYGMETPGNLRDPVRAHVQIAGEGHTG